MLTREENEFLTCTGAGTPMGNLFRSFWLPILMDYELPAPDCPPVRVSVLGERLVAFRNSSGKIGLIDAYCAHRGAELFFGRNEQNGLRCVYHGWKYDTEGRCIDMPNEPQESRFKDKIRLNAYPCQEYGGLIWTYLGQHVQKADLPQLEWARVPATHRFISKVFLDANYLQVMEGDIDNSHLSFLHQFLNPRQKVGTGTVLPGKDYNALDTAPKVDIKDTDYGIMISWRRDAGEDHYFWRITHWLFPGYSIVTAPGPGETILCQVRVPLDDEKSCLFRVQWNPDRPLSREELASYGPGGLLHGEVIPGTFLPKANRSNDFMLDRGLQRTYNFTGIRGQTEQDWAVTLSPGPIVDRTKEHLGTTDKAIIGMRRRLKEAALDLAEGKPPRAARNGEVYRVRSCGVLLKRNIPLEEGAKDLLYASA
jgi:phthalate 4,5-dioxygenase oxygenase subunit